MSLSAQQQSELQYTLSDAQNNPELYKKLFRQYCTELSESDPTIAQYSPDELAAENLQSSLDHPYLIEAGGEPVGLVVFMEEEAPHDDYSCHSYLGEIFVCEAYRGHGIASRIAQKFFGSQKYDAGLCYVRGSSAERFWLNTMARLGYEYKVFTEDDVRDFIHIYLYQSDSTGTESQRSNINDADQ